MLSNNFNIRLANKYDKDKILDICKRIWDGKDYIPRILDEWLLQKKSWLFVVEYDNKITHFSRLRLQSNNDGWIEGLRGDPDYKGKGLAKILIENMINFSKKNSLNKLRFATYFLNRESISLFGKFGFTIINKYLIGNKNIFNINKERKFSIINLNKKNLDKVINFLNSSEVYKQYGSFLSNGWYFEKHRNEVCFEWLKRGYFFSIIDNNEISSLMCLVPQNNNPDKEIISFIDGNTEEMDELVNFAENRAFNNNSHLEFISPAYSNLSKYMIEKKYNLWHHTEENVYLFEKV
jgi:N-acetylglutamate synthase-like GNAT family acetyltransferase